MSTTRWLVRGKVIYNLLVNWEEIKAYFMVEEPNLKSSMRCKAKMILRMLNDPVNLLYFHFLSPVVTEFERVNAYFQTTNADPDEMVRQLFCLQKSLRERIYGFGGGDTILPLSCIDFGVKYLMETNKYMEGQGNSSTAKEIVKDISTRCKSFLVELLQQVRKRLPDNEKLFCGLNNLNQKIALSQMDRPLPVSLPMLHIARDITAVEEQYRQILHVDWASEEVLSGKIPSDSADFWAGVYQFQTVSGHRQFKDLALYALTALATPVSNAVCERVFSQLTCVKTRLRNSMKLQMLDVIIRIRSRTETSASALLEDERILLKRFQANPKKVGTVQFSKHAPIEV